MAAKTRLRAPAVVRACELDAGLLGAAGLELEPVVMLEPTEDGLRVRKLSADEKVERCLRTDEPIFMGSEEDQEAVFAALARRNDG